MVRRAAYGWLLTFVIAPFVLVGLSGVPCVLGALPSGPFAGIPELTIAAVALPLGILSGALLGYAAHHPMRHVRRVRSMRLLEELGEPERPDRVRR